MAQENVSLKVCSHLENLTLSDYDDHKVCIARNSSTRTKNRSSHKR